MARGRGKLTPQDYEYMKIVSNNINHLLETRNKKQIDIVRSTGIPASTLTGYVKGTSLPIPGNVQKIADFFGVKKSQIDPRFKTNKQINEEEIDNSLIAQINTKIAKLHKPRQRKVLIYTDKQLNEQKAEENSKQTVEEPRALYSYNYYDQPASAGTGQYLNDVQVEQIELPVDIDADFVVPIYGDSMEPEYYSGDYVFVKLSVDLSSGDIGVFELYGDAYIKELVIDDSGAYLHSFNAKKYKDIPIDADSDFRIIGEVVGRYSEK